MKIVRFMLLCVLGLMAGAVTPAAHASIAGTPGLGNSLLGAQHARADLDRDGITDAVDVIAFLGTLDRASWAGDFDRSGLVDDRDALAFIDAVEAADTPLSTPAVGGHKTVPTDAFAAFASASAVSQRDRDRDRSQTAESSAAAFYTDAAGLVLAIDRSRELTGCPIGAPSARRGPPLA